MTTETIKKYLNINKQYSNLNDTKITLFQGMFLL